jgi:hypothetical protein
MAQPSIDLHNTHLKNFRSRCGVGTLGLEWASASVTWQAAEEKGGAYERAFCTIGARGELAA